LPPQPDGELRMPKGYFQAYRDLADGHKRFDSKLLVRGGWREVVEGTMRAHNVLREFNSFAEALAYYHGPDYSAAHPLREPYSACNFLIVEGSDGAQPEPVGTPPQPAPLKGYWIVHADVAEAEGYKAFMNAEMLPFGMYGARFLVRGGRQQAMEGRARSRCVVLEFPSYEAALGCYRSPEYQAAKTLRQGKSTFDLVVIEGYGE
jgi:uncharacterized protein (DUF1330 family)